MSAVEVRVFKSAFPNAGYYFLVVRPGDYASKSGDVVLAIGHTDAGAPLMTRAQARAAGEAEALELGYTLDRVPSESTFGVDEYDEVV